MPHIHAAACEVKEGFMSRFSRCKEKPIGMCNYCGRAFCAEHGEVQTDGQEICFRKNCLAKRDDLVAHLQYRALVAKENEAGLCGVPACTEKPDGQCGRCRAYFCMRHIDTREESLMQGRAQVRQMATLCYHCWERRPIWTRL